MLAATFTSNKNENTFWKPWRVTVYMKMIKPKSIAIYHLPEHQNTAQFPTFLRRLSVRHRRDIEHFL